MIGAPSSVPGGRRRGGRGGRSARRALALAAALASAASCNQIASISRGVPYCDAASDCHMVMLVPDCSEAACDDGVCTVRHAPRGTPLGDEKQSLHDCKALVCDGAGGVEEIAAPKDGPDEPPSCPGG